MRFFPVVLLFPRRYFYNGNVALIFPLESQSGQITTFTTFMDIPNKADYALNSLHQTITLLLHYSSTPKITPRHCITDKQLFLNFSG